MKAEPRVSRFPYVVEPRPAPVPKIIGRTSDEVDVLNISHWQLLLSQITQGCNFRVTDDGFTALARLTGITGPTTTHSKGYETCSPSIDEAL